MIEAITGCTVAEFDADFRGTSRPAGGVERHLPLPTKGYDDVTKLEVAAAAAQGPDRAAAVALGYYYAGDADKAEKAAEAARPRRRNPIARYVLAEACSGRPGRKAALYRSLAATATTASTSGPGWPSSPRPGQAGRRREVAVRGEAARPRVELPVPGAGRALQEDARRRGPGPARGLRLPRADAARPAQGAHRRLRQARPLGQGADVRRDGDLYRAERHRRPARPGQADLEIGATRQACTASTARWSRRRRCAGRRWPHRQGPGLPAIGKKRGARAARAALKNEPENAEVLARARSRAEAAARYFSLSVNTVTNRPLRRSGISIATHAVPTRRSSASDAPFQVQPCGVLVTA